MLTDRQARIPAGGGAGGLPEEHRKVLVSSSSTRSRTSLWSPIADDETPRHGLEHGHEAVQVYAATCTPYRGDRRPPGNVGVQLSPVVSTCPRTEASTAARPTRRHWSRSSSSVRHATTGARARRKD